MKRSELGQPGGNAVQDEESKWIPGAAAPEDVDNPPPGENGHRCLDTNGRYQPKWLSLYLDKGQMTPEKQYFSADNAAGCYRVQTGEWVDVPPEIVGVIRGCVIESSEVVVVPGPEGPVKQQRTVRVPRFQFSVLPSA